MRRSMDQVNQQMPDAQEVAPKFSPVNANLSDSKPAEPSKCKRTVTVCTTLKRCKAGTLRILPPAVLCSARVFLTLLLPALIIGSPDPVRATPSLVSGELLRRWGVSDTWVAPSTSAQQRRVAEAYGRLPLTFETNVGQSDPRVRFLARGPGYTLFLTAAAEAVLVSGKDRPQVVRLELAGAVNLRPEVRAQEERASKSYYFIGNDPVRWRTRVAHYGRVRYEGVYPGVDLVYYGDGRRLEYDWVVAPGADPSRIQLRLAAAGSLRLDEVSGDLELAGAAGEVRLQKPVAYQLVAGQRVAVEARYALTAANGVGLTLGHYDTAEPLIIDPVLDYSTFLGGSSYDYGRGIALDAWGNAYVTGEIESDDFPLAHPLPEPNNALRGLFDAFVSKLEFNGRTGALSLVYSAYLGGSDTSRGGTDGYDGANGIALDDSGNVYLTGFTFSADFPLANPLSTLNKPGPDFPMVFVSKLHFDGKACTLSLAYSTLLGGSSFDVGNGIAVDAWGDAYVTGETDSKDFPLADPLPAPNNALQGFRDAFVSKLHFDAKTCSLSLAYSTFLGGKETGVEEGRGIAVDARGNAYVTGSTTSADFPTEHPLPAPNNALQGSQNAFVSKLKFDDRTETLTLAYSTFLGGKGSVDQGNGIAVDARGNSYVTGTTTSAAFPLAHPLSTNGCLRGSGNAFVSKLRFDPESGTLALAYSTYLGGNGGKAHQGDQGLGIAVDARDSAYVTGLTTSTDFPLVHPLPANDAFRGIQTAFVSKLRFEDRTATLVLDYSTYLGGSGGDAGDGIAVDARENAYVTGFTGSADFPTVHPLPTNIIFRGALDAFVAKIRTARFEDHDACEGRDADDEH